jgi:hypothetical protein
MDLFLENNKVLSGRAFLDNNVVVGSANSIINIGKSTKHIFVTDVLEVGGNVLKTI